MSNLSRFLPLLFLWLVWLPSGAENQMREENKLCLKCHQNQTYTFVNEWTSKEERRLMNPYHIIDTVLFMNGVHKGFACTDCHSTEYGTYPHARELKLEPLSNCLDCHGGDKTFEKYHFEQIDQEFQNSVHVREVGEFFTCSKCHNPHYYKVIARTSSNVSEIVNADNQMCLSCHNNEVRYRLTSLHDYPDFNRAHAWLPNHELHFRSVRCLDCHTKVTDSLMISHDILTSKESLKSCSECHSATSVLKASLYKYENLKAREKSGIVSTFRQERPYIIGANQAPVFKFVTIGILILTLLGIIIHSVFRYVHKKKYIYPPGKRVYFYPLWLRSWHLVNAVGIIILIITGFIMHYGIHGSFIGFNFAVNLHNSTGIVVAISYFFFFIGNILFYNSRYYRLTLRGWQTKIFKQAMYYINGMFKGEHPPFPVTERRKFNPLQKTSYFFIMFLFVPLMVVSGLALMFPEFIIERVYRYNGVFLTAMLHAAMGFVLFIFLLVHIYVSTVGRDPLANFKSIVDGWHEVHEPEEQVQEQPKDA